VMVVLTSPASNYRTSTRTAIAEERAVTDSGICLIPALATGRILSSQ
jgi:hypothetical protein